MAADFKAAKARGDAAFDEAAQLNPAKANQYRVFRDRFDRVYAAAQRPVDIGSSFPSLTAIKTFSPKDLDQLAAGAAAMQVLDGDLTALAADIQAFNTAAEADNAKTTSALRRDAANTIVLMIGLGLLSTLPVGTPSPTVQLPCRHLTLHPHIKT